MSECVEFALVPNPHPIFEIGMCVSVAGESAPGLPTYTTQAALEAVTEDEFGIATFDVGTLLGFPGLLIGTYSVVSQFHVTNVPGATAVQQIVLSENMLIQRARNFSNAWGPWALAPQGMPAPVAGWMMVGSPDSTTWQVVDPTTVIVPKDTLWRALTPPAVFGPSSLVHLRRNELDVYLELTLAIPVAGAANTLITTLPVGYRPHVNRSQAVLYQSSVTPPVWAMRGAVTVSTTGQVFWSSDFTSPGGQEYTTLRVALTWPANTAFPNPPYPGTPTA